MYLHLYIYKVSLGRVQKKWMTLRGREQDSYNTGWDIFPLESFVALTYQTFLKNYIFKKHTAFFLPSFLSLVKNYEAASSSVNHSKVPSDADFSLLHLFNQSARYILSLSNSVNLRLGALLTHRCLLGYGFAVISICVEKKIWGSLGSSCTKLLF